MKLAQPMRLLLLGGALAAVSAIALLAGALNSTTTQADDVAGEYSLSVHATDAAGVDVTTLATGETFEARVGISYLGDPPEDCFVSVPPPFGCYQAAQWNLDYDETILQTAVETCTGAAACTHIARVTGSPTSCNQEAENGLRTLVGCFSISGPDISYEGDAIRITYSCLAPGISPLTLTIDDQASFVSDGSTEQTIHLHNDTIECTGTASTATPVPTETVAGTAVPATSTPTFVRQQTRTSTPVPTGTPDPNATVPPGGETPPPPPPPPPGDGGAGPVSGSPTRTGTGGTGAGGLRPPDTGTGGQAGGLGAVEWVWLALGGTGIALATAGTAAHWRRGR